MTLHSSSAAGPSVQSYLESNSDPNIFHTLVAQLKAVAQRLAQDPPHRAVFLQAGALDDAVDSTAQLYSAYEEQEAARVAATVNEVEAGLERKAVDDLELTPRAQLVQLLTLHVRVLRNALAACPEAQQQLSLQLGRLQPLLLSTTSFHAMTDGETVVLTRAVAQMLSNLVTANPTVQSQLWTRLVVASAPADKIALKLLSSPDTPTQSAAQVLLINFLKSSRDPVQASDRCKDLCTTPAGLEIVEALLQVAESIVLQTDSDETPEDAQSLEESLGLTYSIFVHVFEQGYGARLVQELAPLEVISTEASSQDQQVTSSSQLVLLKLLDSWLHFGQKQLLQGTPDTQIPTLSVRSSQYAGLDGLVAVFAKLSQFARSAMARGTVKEGEDETEKPQDRRLIGVHHALLLVLQCLLSITMSADGWSCASDAAIDGDVVELGLVARRVLTHLRSRAEFIDELVDLLNQTHLYAPALSPFRPKEEANGPTMPLPTGHALSSTGQAASQQQPSYGFDHLKRDIVRVIGSVVYSPLANSSTRVTTDDASANRQDDLDLSRRQIRFVQDRVREKGGLFHVLNMTVLDERNPYMREHAIFALRYLLANNQTSQELVASLQPTAANGSDSQRGGVAIPMS